MWIRKATKKIKCTCDSGGTVGASPVSLFIINLYLDRNTMNFCTWLDMVLTVLTA